MKNVLILYKSMPQYRIEFFSLLKKELSKEGVNLSIIYGSLDTKGKCDDREIEFGNYKANKLIRLGKSTLVWQPCLEEIKETDLVIVEQASKLLINYVLLIRRFFKRKKFAFWGHGLNMQARPDSFLNRFKRTYSNYTDHWFAYTPNIKTRLVDQGYNKDQITVVNNAIDTKKSEALYDSIAAEEKLKLKQDLDIADDEFVFIYCGALYKEKRLDFLVEAGDKIAAAGHKFKLLIVGGGPDADFVKTAALTRKWMIIAGPKFEREKALFFSISDLFLMPGAIGLAILDAFAFMTPMITTSYEFHGPEFEYLINNHNGIITANTMEDYLESIFRLIRNPSLILTLKENCRKSSEDYTIEDMVENFKKGVHKALADHGHFQ